MQPGLPRGSGLFGPLQRRQEHDPGARLLGRPARQDVLQLGSRARQRRENARQLSRLVLNAASPDVDPTDFQCHRLLS